MSVPVPDEISVCDLKIKKYDADLFSQWDAVIDLSINGTIFHKRHFLDYHPPDRFTDASLTFWEGSNLLSVFPAALQNINGLRILKSHPGASYGGLILRESYGVDKIESIITALINYARETGIDRIEFRQAEKIFNKLPCDQLDFILLRHGFYPDHYELSTCYPLTKYLNEECLTDEEIINTFRPSCRRAVRKAMSHNLTAGFCTQRDEFNQYWDILEENLTKHKTKPAHTRDEIWDLKQRFPKDIHLIGIFYKNLMLGGIVTFVCNSQGTHVMYFSSVSEHQDKRPLNLAVFELIKYAHSRKLKFINFGISVENRGKIVNKGLFRFKESFNGCGILRVYWTKDITSEKND